MGLNLIFHGESGLWNNKALLTEPHMGVMTPPCLLICPCLFIRCVFSQHTAGSPPSRNAICLLLSGGLIPRRLRWQVFTLHYEQMWERKAAWKRVDRTVSADTVPPLSTVPRFSFYQLDHILWPVVVILIDSVVFSADDVSSALWSAMWASFHSAAQALSPKTQKNGTSS